MYWDRKNGRISTSDIQKLGISTLRTFNSWVWVLALLGIGSRYLTFRNRLLQYASEAVLPFYILHQSVIVATGFFIINWNIPIIVKYLFLSLTSFTIIILIYEYVVKRLGFMRFLFGLKGHKKRA